MNHNGFGARMLRGMRNPLALLASTFGGALVWVSGGSITLWATTASAMLVTAVLVGAGTGGHSSAPLRIGTEQHGLVVLFDGHVRSLRALRGKVSSDVVGGKADDALAAADAARPSVVQTASAVDALDEAISAARKVFGQGEHATESIRGSVARLRVRRDGLIEKLAAAVDEVATVYAGLLELSATARTVGVSVDGGDVGAVNDSVTLLQMTFAELEADAARLTSEGLL